MMSRDSGLTGSLFERITEAANPSSYQNPKEALVRSIRRNLQQILNTRSGSCYGSPELGITDLDNIASVSMNLRDTTARAIRNCILRYEPRISDAIVTAVEQDENAPLELRFRIVASVSFSEIKNVLEFDIVLDSHQQYRVE
ncbi:type VI secretion system baseplate subunit TssE [Salmonella enterica]|uniref:Type VI secretion system baseplate subunit TssE n=1 Tax=Salmonella enterica subsp. enterica serovar Lattenkamp TaxID=2564671 RepID=A0A5W2M3G7_SALET|nr:type VI secretion system baseplate subunit TssE [Salmonella enterica subsp. enterica serovar Lattenkamp]EAQ8609634.1 type VI secretion system baseplate subunit TssE [Salmonella enterica]ECJ3925368.1 type VI secretion system baseplate subunit TssE [Salmonella enterica subsp. enterica]EAR5597267.1 type VI secretion system baseplate subunit TssE [Salmonella enterica]EAV2737215.1 type VI secretion system baseplate subunit TssE [Salmonella enterica]